MDEYEENIDDLLEMEREMQMEDQYNDFEETFVEEEFTTENTKQDASAPQKPINREGKPDQFKSFDTVEVTADYLLNSEHKTRSHKDMAKYIQSIRASSITQEQILDYQNIQFFESSTQFLKEIPRYPRAEFTETACCLYNSIQSHQSIDEFHSIILSNQKRYYLKDRKSKISSSSAVVSHSTSTSSSSHYFDPNKPNLLSISFKELYSEAEDLRIQQRLANSQQLQQQQNTNKNKNNHDLWVDKYAPKSFTQLLSNEKTNREVSLLKINY
jgi:hypothetical protein